MPYPSSTKPTQPTAVKNVYQAAPLHYVNIGHELDGNYKFGYYTGKGPLGQSFREEIRLADGTISGTYGVVDELGHKRVVHYSSGKTGFFSQEEPVSKATPKDIPSTTSAPQPKFVGIPNLNDIGRHFTSPLTSFSLASYLQSKTTAPISRQSTAVQPKIIPAPRLQTYAVSTEQQKSMMPYIESYRTGNLQRQAKVDALAKAQSLQKKEAMHSTSSYDPKVEDEYYDSAPPFIDVERLSYNIGTDKNVSFKV
ncbi:uncharacterized protein CDAR_269911 [Caerostris darwini]|uniref:Cuticle protein 6 n=1 Tax=Caerostris darwini TaxID=1538125 RepID=A0AAV4RQF4_9ARAC|nr:uncharacterized protein CDAR_269911 [Caerostris darwini]